MTHVAANGVTSQNSYYKDIYAWTGEGIEYKWWGQEEGRTTVLSIAVSLLAGSVC